MSTMDSLYMTMMWLVGFSFEYIKNTVNLLIGNLQEINLNDIFTNVFLFIAWLKNWVEVNAKYMYDTYPFVRENTDMVCYAFDYGKAHLNGYRIEPFNNNWISLSFLEKYNSELFVGNKYVYSEQYYVIKTDTTLSPDELYKQCLEHVTEIAKSSCNSSIFETMITMKVSDKYLCSSFFHNENNTTPVYTLSKNKGKNYFLSVEYTHPKMSSGIVLNLPTNVYNATSNILTPAFIKRYLEYQEQSYVFDMRYTLKILDTNINMFNMKSNQYIRINDRSYDVVINETVCEDEPESETEEEKEDSVYNTDEDANHADDEKGESDTDEEDTLDVDIIPQCENNESKDLPVCVDVVLEQDQDQEQEPMVLKVNEEAMDLSENVDSEKELSELSELSELLETESKTIENNNNEEANHLSECVDLEKELPNTEETDSKTLNKEDTE